MSHRGRWSKTKFERALAESTISELLSVRLSTEQECRGESMTGLLRTGLLKVSRLYFATELADMSAPIAIRIALVNWRLERLARRSSLANGAITNGWCRG